MRSKPRLPAETEIRFNAANGNGVYTGTIQARDLGPGLYRVKTGNSTVYTVVLASDIIEILDEPTKDKITKQKQDERLPVGTKVRFESRIAGMYNGIIEGIDVESDLYLIRDKSNFVFSVHGEDILEIITRHRTRIDKSNPNFTFKRKIH